VGVGAGEACCKKQMQSRKYKYSASKDIPVPFQSKYSASKDIPRKIGV
jgi:hypothetical protein